jgi:hypothetical protein
MARPGLVAALALALAAGCVSSRPIATGEIPTLAADEGILVLDVESDVPIERLALNGVVVAEFLEPGRRLALLAVGAGSYRWTSIQIPGTFGSLRFRMRREDEWTFRVEPGKINYTGRLEVEQRRSGLGSVQLVGRNVNRSAMAWVELGKRFPLVVGRYPVVYSGPAQDAFLARLATLQASRRAAAAPSAPE